MRNLVIALIIALIVGHHDFWWWNNHQTLVLGCLPVGLAYHAGISVAAACVWALTVKYCWPNELDEFEEAITPANAGGDA